MNYHNPEQLSEWGQADGWRLLTTQEIEQPLPDDAQWFNLGCWEDQEGCNVQWTYRTKKPLPVSPLIAQLDADIKAKQELRDIALAVEAGAEWEVDGGGTGTDWHKPDYELKWYLREERACPWQVRLKPKPVTRPWSIADVPWNCRLRGKEKVHEGYWFVPFTADPTGITILSGGKPTHQTWKDLETFWNYTTPELNGEWKPCETTEEAK